MARIFTDIETLPTDNPLVMAHIQAQLKPPGSMSKPETIQKWLDDPVNLNNALAKTGLSGKFGRIACIGIAGEVGEPDIISGRECDILEEFISNVRHTLGGGTPRLDELIGHNSDDFDLPFISQRMQVHGMGPLFHFDDKPFDRRTADTEVMFLGNPRDYLSLVDLCMALGVQKPLDEIDGSQVAQAWKDGRKDLVYEHCRSDVAATRACYFKMRNEYPLGWWEVPEQQSMFSPASPDPAYI